jgi:archaellum component FlaC
MNTKLLTSIILSLLIGTGIGYSASFSEMSTLQSKASSLESEISTLTTDYNNLNTTFNQLKDNYNNLSSEYSELSTQCNLLQSNYSSLNSTYYELQMAYEQLEEAYRFLNSTGLVFEGLKISDLKLVQEEPYWMGYELVGNITNVSDKPMNNIYIIVFEYRNELLYDYEVEIVENLAENETNEFRIGWYSGLVENQKIKILAIGDYGAAIVPELVKS